MNNIDIEPKRILLVEDDPFLVEIYTIKLKGAGFAVESALDGEECFEKLAEKKPDLILLDIVLPNMDGWEILKKIKADEYFKDLKVIMLSNLGQREEVEKGIKMGAESYLIKSQYTPTEVVAAIKKIMEK